MKEEALRMEHVRGNEGLCPLYSLSLSVRQGEICGVVGLRNSGITEMFNILSGKLSYQSGSIYVNERRVRQSAFSHPELLGIAVIHYSSVLNEKLTVAENILLLNHLKNKPRLLHTRTLEEQAGNLLHSLGIEIPAHKMASELTPAQQHAILIARAVYEGSRIIVLENIQQQYSQREMDGLGWLMRRTARQGISYIYKCYHDSYMFQYMDKLTFLRGGVTVGEYERKYFTDMYSVRDMLGQTGDEQLAQERQKTGNASSGREILRVEKMVTSGNSTPVSFSLREGETLVILDEEGSRGTELISVLSGKEPRFYRSGKVFVGQREIPVSPGRNKMRKWAAFIPENAAKTGVLKNRSIADNMLLTKLASGRRGLWCVRRRMENFVTKEFLESLPRESREKFGAGIKAGDLDEIGRYELLFYNNLKNSCRVFIMENPFAYNDEATRELIKRRIFELNQKGIGVVMNVHDMSSVPKTNYRILKL